MDVLLLVVNGESARNVVGLISLKLRRIKLYKIHFVTRRKKVRTLRFLGIRTMICRLGDAIISAENEGCDKVVVELHKKVLFIKYTCINCGHKHFISGECSYGGCKCKKYNNDYLHKEK